VMNFVAEVISTTAHLPSDPGDPPVRCPAKPRPRPRRTPQETSTGAQSRQTDRTASGGGQGSAARTGREGARGAAADRGGGFGGLWADGSLGASTPCRRHPLRGRRSARWARPHPRRDPRSPFDRGGHRVHRPQRTHLPDPAPAVRLPRCEHPARRDVDVGALRRLRSGIRGGAWDTRSVPDSGQSAPALPADAHRGPAFPPRCSRLVASAHDGHRADPGPIRGRPRVLRLLPGAFPGPGRVRGLVVRTRHRVGLPGALPVRLPGQPRAVVGHRVAAVAHRRRGFAQLRRGGRQGAVGDRHGHAGAGVGADGGRSSTAPSSPRIRIRRCGCWQHPARRSPRCSGLSATR
jgi:hypothetical protein